MKGKQQGRKKTTVWTKKKTRQDSWSRNVTVERKNPSISQVRDVFTFFYDFKNNRLPRNRFPWVSGKCVPSKKLWKSVIELINRPVWKEPRAYRLSLADTACGRDHIVENWLGHNWKVHGSEDELPVRPFPVELRFFCLLETGNERVIKGIGCKSIRAGFRLALKFHLLDVDLSRSVIKLWCAKHTKLWKVLSLLLWESATH